MAVYLLRKALDLQANQAIPTSISDLWQQGLGEVSPFALLGKEWKAGMTLREFSYQILLTNAFQLLVSCMYLLFNNIISRQLVAAEWVRLLDAKEKKTLRVSSPQGLQRSSYLLSLPFVYAVPLTVFFALLHWLVSQSIFIVQTTVYESGSENVRMGWKDGSRIGYSAIGIVFVIAAVALLICGSLVHSAVRRHRNVPAEFPSLGTCSAAISAVCHPPNGDTDAHLAGVSMGVVAQGHLEQGRLTLSTWDGLQEPRRLSYFSHPVRDPPCTCECTCKQPPCGRIVVEQGFRG